MPKCPFINKQPSYMNCKDCYFHVGVPSSNITACAIVLSADKSQRVFEILDRKFRNTSF